MAKKQELKGNQMVQHTIRVNKDLDEQIRKYAALKQQSISNVLRELIVQSLDITTQESEILKETNSELENLNWISTHDLQEPLRKIQLFISKMLTEPNVVEMDSIFNSLQRVSKSAHRMRTLLDDILKFFAFESSFELCEFVFQFFFFDQCCLFFFVVIW